MDRLEIVLVSVSYLKSSWLLHQFRNLKLALNGKHTGQVCLSKDNISPTRQQYILGLCISDPVYWM
jgi:hypothetical protein